MKVVLFYHSILSCWNHGNVHFLRGVARELVRRGHEVVVYEPQDGWSRQNAIADGGSSVLEETATLVPGVIVRSYHSRALDLDAATGGADLVIVHEWNPPALVEALGRLRASGAGFTLLFHDTHHRSVSARHEIEQFDLDGFDGVLAFGDVIREFYVSAGWGRQAFTWHEAADTALFRPLPASSKDSDVIWIGNWGDDERSRELETYLINPIATLALRTRIHGVRYPEAVTAMLAGRGIHFAGWLPNHRAPRAYARSRVTVHIPRRPYVDALPGIPTIRVFEALACGIPLISSPWSDAEGLFPQGSYLTARNEDDMTAALRLVLSDAALAQSQIETGLRAISDRHTCAHRVDELLAIVARLQRNDAAAPLRARPQEKRPTLS
jgi:spore maturation protein CgeB